MSLRLVFAKRQIGVAKSIPPCLLNVIQFVVESVAGFSAC